MKVNFAKWRAIGAISVVLLGILSQFQNCAAPSAVTSAPDAGQRVVDDWGNQKVSLFANVIEPIASDLSINIDGFCERKMDATDPLLWEVSEASAARPVRLAGEVFCERGGFRVEVAGLNSLVCGATYEFAIHASDGSMDQAVLVRKCPQ